MAAEEMNGAETSKRGTVYDTATGRVKRVTGNMDRHPLLTGEAMLAGVAAIPGEKVDITAVPPTLVSDPAALDQLALVRVAAFADIDRMAGEMRSRIGSQGFGQEMTYLAKEAEATAFLADPAPDTAGYPLLAAEVGVTGGDLAAVAAVVAAMARSWRHGAGQIEAVRLGAKQAVASAGDTATIDQIVAALAWPSLAQSGQR